MQEVKEKIINFVQMNGPVLPVEISKAMGTDIIFAGAILSELVANKKIMISTAKIGGSPVYYTDSQKTKLQMLIDKLGERPNKAALMLREKKILFDKEVEPWVRVALREIKDFAVPLRIGLNGEEIIVWKWYLLSNEEIKPLVSKALGLDKKEEAEEKPVVKVEEKEIIKPEVKVETKEVKKLEPKETKKPEVVKPSVKIDSTGDFYNDILAYLRENGLNIVKEEVVSKKKEFDFIVEYKSNFGLLRFFVKAKDKKKLNESDLDLALHKAKNKSVLFLTKGELTKKAQSYLEKELRGSLVFCNI